jgi:hypothetical protein
MPKTSTVKRVHKWKPFTGRPAGGPKSRWEDDVRNDLKKMKLINWQNKYRTVLNGRILSRRPRLYQSCSAIEEEEVYLFIYLSERNHTLALIFLNFKLTLILAQL